MYCDQIEIFLATHDNIKDIKALAHVMFCKNLGEQFVCEWLQIVSTHGKTMVHNSIPTSLNEALTYNLIYWPLSYTWVYGMDTVCVCMHYPITVNIWCSITAFTILFCCCHCLSLFLSFTLSPPAPIHLSSFFPLPVPLSGLQLNLQSNWEKKNTTGGAWTNLGGLCPLAYVLALLL